MNVAVAMTVLTGVALLWIWAPAYPKPERHPHLRAMDALADPIRLHDCGRFHRPSEDCPVSPCWACRGTGDVERLGGGAGACWECKGTGEVDVDA